MGADGNPDRVNGVFRERTERVKNLRTVGFGEPFLDLSLFRNKYHNGGKLE